MCVTSVSNPVGRKISVAGNSFIAVRNTSAAPATTPGAISGRVTRPNARVGVSPSVRAASTSRGSTCSVEVRIAPTAWGMNRTT